MNGNAANTINAPAEGVVESITEFINDISTLGELQVKLAAIDLKEASGRATTPVILLVVGVLLLLAGVPVILLGVADLIASAGLSQGLARLLTGVLALALAGVLAWVALKGLNHSFTSFRRSKEELTRNLSWIKTVVVYSGRAVKKPLRR